MESRLLSYIEGFKSYEKESSRKAALAVVPHDFLLGVAEAKFESSGSAISCGPDKREGIVRDMFLAELMNWFKTEFFTWMDSPTCPRCKGGTTGIGNGTPTPEELAKSAGRVELFTCSACFSDGREVARFPRYNDPVVLLQSRTGRCGEWANCFALICRATGFEVRHVVDWTDHVWVEVFSCSLSPNRWVHVDPCENSYDSPLLYSKGWGKKLSYVMAFSQDDVQDVTWRYIEESDLKSTLARRRLIDEVTLVQLILRLRAQLQRNLADNRKQVLMQRLSQEIVEFLYPRNAARGLKESEMVGRDSGSLAWRLARQEIGSDTIKEDEDGYEWTLDSSVICNSKFEVTYDCVSDSYKVAKQGTPVEVARGFATRAKTVKNLFRKVEHDWKMVYLARHEHSTERQAAVSWKFKLPENQSCIRSARVAVSIFTFHPSAKIKVLLSDEKGHLYNIAETNQAKGLTTWSSDMDSKFQSCNSRSLTLTCTLEGGEGSAGWQHAQLFRQSLTDTLTFGGLKVELEIAPSN